MSRGDSVAWFTNRDGNWTLEAHSGGGPATVPDRLLASAADEERPLREGEWLVIPVMGPMESHVLAIHRSSVPQIASWIVEPAHALATLQHLWQIQQAGSLHSEQAPARGMPFGSAANSQLLGESPAIQELRRRIDRIADSELTVLIHGENGTGKDIVGRLIHERSPRAAGPCLVVNCAALTESLLESELFGHERGAFTDAKESRAGKFELARGGTLFLDEVGELSPRAQAQLLRVLEDKTVMRVGGHEPLDVDTRLVAATNRNLAEMVQAELFRRDLFFRLNVVTLELPPLRDRGNDIELLATYFLQQAARQRGRPSPRLSAAAVQALHAYPWPGNVRELRNVMERVTYLHDDEWIDVASLGLTADSVTTPFPVESGLTLAEATRQFQIAYVEHHLRGVFGNMTETAQRLGLHRTNLYRKMKQLGMTPPG